ncbi:MAG: hypothetical protein ACRC78_23895 [Planktothrix sp.]
MLQNETYKLAAMAALAYETARRRCIDFLQESQEYEQACTLYKNENLRNTFSELEKLQLKKVCAQGDAKARQLLKAFKATN